MMQDAYKEHTLSIYLGGTIYLKGPFQLLFTPLSPLPQIMKGDTGVNQRRYCVGLLLTVM